MKKLFTTALAAMMLLGGTMVSASDYPNKTVEVITHAGAGGGTDVTARMMMLRARRVLGEDMVVVNKRGGGGSVAMDYYLDQPADGYSILTFTIGHAAELAKNKTKMTLDDVRPIARGTDDPQILMVRCGVYDSAQSFVDAQKDKPLTYGQRTLEILMMFQHLCSRSEATLQHQRLFHSMAVVNWQPN